MKNNIRKEPDAQGYGGLARSDFLSAVFPFGLLEKNERVLVSHPAQFTDSHGVHAYHRQKFWTPRSPSLDRTEAGWLYCVSTVKVADKPRRRAIDVRQAFVVPCDDIGTKSKKPPVSPSYILETSPGNFQYGYFINPFDVSPESNGGFEYYDGVLLGLARAGYNDEGCRSATRVIKMPGSLHHSGFVTRLVEWNPGHWWTLAELVKAMGIEVVPLARKKHVPSNGVESLDGIMDAVYDWLVNNNMVLGVGSGGFLSIRCPWASEHSSPEDVAAGYSPDGYGGEGRGFKCFHSHCARRTTIDLIQWVFEQGGQGLPY